MPQLDPAHPPVQPNEFDGKWLLALKAGAEMKRTVKLAGYPKIPAGRFLAKLDFHSPLYVPENQMKQADGRVWYGGILAEKVITTSKLNEPRF